MLCSAVLYRTLLHEVLCPALNKFRDVDVLVIFCFSFCFLYLCLPYQSIASLCTKSCTHHLCLSPNHFHFISTLHPPYLNTSPPGHGQFSNSRDVPLVSLRRTTTNTTPGIGGGSRTLLYNSYNKSENNVLVTSESEVTSLLSYHSCTSHIYRFR